MNAAIELAIGNLEKVIAGNISEPLRDLLLVELNEFRESVRFTVACEEALNAV